MTDVPVAGPSTPTAAAGKPRQGGALAALVGLIGAATAGALISDIKSDEGRKLHAYRDIAKIVTICDGDTHNVRMGQVATDVECDERTAKQLLVHARIVASCSPSLLEQGRELELRAYTRMDYNTGAFCKGWFRHRSPIAALVNAGKRRAGCDELMQYDLVRGRHVRGLTLRRAREQQICVGGLPK
jgi:lysozyme